MVEAEMKDTDVTGTEAAGSETTETETIGTASDSTVITGTLAKMHNLLAGDSDSFETPSVAYDPWVTRKSP